MIGATMLGVVVLLGCASMNEQAKLPDITETPIISFYSTRTDEYLRPAWKRLLYSIRPYTETVTSNGQAHLDHERLTYSGSYLDDQKPKMTDWMPVSYALGATGELEF
jgi:hypothetical protein